MLSCFQVLFVCVCVRVSQYVLLQNTAPTIPFYFSVYGPVNPVQLLPPSTHVQSYRMANRKRFDTYTYVFVVFKQLSYSRTHVSHIDLAF